MTQLAGRPASPSSPAPGGNGLAVRRLVESGHGKGSVDQVIKVDELSIKEKPRLFENMELCSYCVRLVSGM